MTDAVNIFNRIKETLHASNAPEIARKIGITKQSVYEWEEKIPSLEKLRIIAETGNVSLHWLITGEGSKEVIDSKQAGLINTYNLKEIIREVVQEELAKVKILENVQELGNVDGFDFYKAIENDEEPLKILHDYAASEKFDLEMYALSFSGWETFTPDEKIKQIKAILDSQKRKKTLEELKKEAFKKK